VKGVERRREASPCRERVEFIDNQQVTEREGWWEVGWEGGRGERERAREREREREREKERERLSGSRVRCGRAGDMRAILYLSFPLIEGAKTLV
jgi:hypothetical protein